MPGVPRVPNVPKVLVQRCVGYLVQRVRPGAGRLPPRVATQEVPAVPFEIEKHGKSAIWLIARRRHEPHAGGDHALVVTIKIVHAQEHADAIGELPAHNACLYVAIGTREQNAGLASPWTNHDPTLRATVIGQRRRIFHQLKLQDVNEETDSGVVVPHHQRDEFKMRHRRSDYSGVVTNRFPVPRSRSAPTSTASLRLPCRLRFGVADSRTINASAPIRICDLGGWTDTWAARRGAVLNIAVRPLVEVELRTFPGGTQEARVVIDAANYQLRYAADLDASGWGPHPLLEAALRAIRPPADLDLVVTVRSDAPAGASTGTSAAVLVALLGALDRLAGGARSPGEIAREAHAVETRRLGQQSGVQDQLCAAYGGINFIDIVEYPRSEVRPLRLAGDAVETLGRRLLLIYLGRPHDSSAVHERVMADLARVGPDCPTLQALRAAAVKGRDALLSGDLVGFGEAMRENTDAQAWLHSDLVPSDMWDLIDLAKAHGAVGWKVNGAGGNGGSLTLLTDDRQDARVALLRSISQEHPQAVAIPITISHDGLQVWTSGSGVTTS